MSKRFQLRKGFTRAAQAALFAGFATVVTACGGPDASQVTAHYGELVHTSYKLSYDKAVELDEAIDNFVQNPTADGLEAAKTAWLNARNPYGETEVFRFYEGPIDNAENGPEGQINAWPLDESYIDAVSVAGATNPEDSIVGDTSVTIDTDTLISLNEKNSEENIATGYHAIEFLLWGQDNNADGPGDRAYTDFVDGELANADRRREYLSVASTLLVSDLDSMVKAWAPDADNFRKEFVAQDAKVALTNMLTGMGALSGFELGGERINVAYDTKAQEDEHSCFSDNTHNDIIANAQGILNVYTGSVGDLTGPSLSEYVRAQDADLDKRVLAALEDSVAKAKAIPAPFDQAILGSDDSAGRTAVKATIEALEAQETVIVEVATLLDITLNLPTE